MLPDVDAVSRLIEQVAAEEVLPRFRDLAEGEVRRKHGGEVVTVVDEAVERRLETALHDLAPGSLILGEEAAAADPTVFQHLDHEGSVWVIDPVDGTANFANGVPTFAVMLAFLCGQDTVMSWIHMPIAGETAAAMAGEGAWIGGRRLKVAEPVPLAEMVGTLHAGQFAPEQMVRHVQQRRGRVKAIKSLRCAGAEYLRLAKGEMHFSLFTKMMPWDHAPGVLLHREAGGAGRTLDGEDYRASMIKARGLLLAPDAASWQALEEVLFGPG